MAFKCPFALLLLVLIVCGCSDAFAQEAVSKDETKTPEQRGLDFLLNKPYLPADFDQETFDALWKVWPEEKQAKAEAASAEVRRQMLYEHYGLTERPDDTSGKPMQFVVDDSGMWTMNCLSCHGGQVMGKPYPGRPNDRFMIQKLYEDIRQVKLLQGKSLGRMDVATLVFPLGNNRGTTNAVMFGVALMNYRDADLNYHATRFPPRLTHHDMDPPPWWHYSKKNMLYIDGFAEQNPRALMQFTMVKDNGPEKFRAWEKDYQDIEAYLQSLEPPKFSDYLTEKIDAKLAEKGRLIFNENCSRCHGTYGEDGRYPELNVSLDELGTDPVRHKALTAQSRKAYGESWFAHYGKEKLVPEPAGYVAPPLDGVWASAPYFHNGSVPTLWHVLHPKERPKLWRRVTLDSKESFDAERVGLKVETLEAAPEKPTREEVWDYFDTTKFGKSAAGHLFPDELTEEQKQAVLEYLKTL